LPAKFNLAFAQENPHSSEEELILSLEMNGYQLSDAFLVYEIDNKIFLPLLDTLSFLELKFEIDNSTSTGQGWIINPNRFISVDFKKSNATVEGRSISFDPSEIIIKSEMLFVSIDLFSDLWPVTFQLNKRSQSLNVNGKEKLPLESRLEREEKRKKLNNRPKSKSALPLKEMPYSSGTFPSLDFNLSTGYDKERYSYSQFNVTGAGDLAESGIDFFLSGDSKKSVTDGRLTVGRESNEGNVFGVSELKTVKVGDVLLPGLNLISNPRFERGIQISTAPLSYLSDLGQITIEGRGSPAAEVELYRENELIDFQIVNSDGRYTFVNVPLSVGKNEYKALVYQPNGQVEEFIYSYRIEDFLLKPGASSLQAFVTETGYSTSQYFGVDNPNQPSKKETSSLIQYDYGLSPLLSGKIFYARMPDRQSLIDDNQFRSLTSLRPLFPSSFDSSISRAQSSFMNSYTGAGLKTAWFKTYWKADYAKDDNNGSASEINALTGFDRYTFNYAQARFDNFISANTAFNGDVLKNKHKFRVAGNWMIVPQYNTDSDLIWERRTGVLDSTEERAIWRLSQRMQKVRLTNHVNQTWFKSYTGSSIPTRTGDLEAYTRYNFWDYTAGLTYDIQETTKGTAVRYIMGYDTVNNQRLDLGWQRDLSPIKDTYVAQFSKKWKEFRTGLQLRWDQQSEWTALATLTFGIAQNPSSNNLFVSSESLASTGMIYPEIQLERYDNNESKIKTELLPDGDVLINGQEKKSEYDRPLPKVIRGLPSGEKTDVSVAITSLSDPYWSPATKGYSIIPRRGVILKTPFKVIETGEVEGLLIFQETPATSVKINIINQKGESLAQTRSGFDGSFYFNNLAPGKYLIKSSPEQDRRWKNLLPFEQELMITPDKLGVLDIKIKVSNK
jgi:hypothetical protein